MTRYFRPRRYLGAVGLLGALITALTATGTGAVAGAETDFVAGSGRARANLFEILPRTGGLTIPVNLGRALTTYRGTAATASSTAVKPPSEPPLERAAADDCSTAPVHGRGARSGTSTADRKAPSTDIPFASTLEVNSEQQGAETGRQANLAATPPESPIQGVLQHQEVAASREPLGRASTTTGRLAFAGLAELTGGQAEARTGVADGRTRLAEAAVTVARLVLVDGLIVLENLRWEAVQRTGAGERAEGSFSIGRVAVSGVPLPAPPTGADPLVPVNQALAPTGLALDPPRFDPSGGVARVSPLSLRLADSALGRQVAGPLVTALQPVRDPVAQRLLAVSCDFGLAITVADVAAGILSGSGGVSFDIGGVSATTEGVRYDNPLAGPFGDGSLGFEAQPPSLDSPAGAGPAAVQRPDNPNGPVHLDDPTSSLLPIDEPGLSRPSPDPRPSQEMAGALPGSGGAQPAFLGPTSSRLPGHRGGTALVVGFVGLAGIVLVAAADALHVRRSTRSIP